MFIVVCRGDRVGKKAGPYVLSTRQVFATRQVAERYRKTIAPSRQPIVVEGAWYKLRFELEDGRPSMKPECVNPNLAVDDACPSRDSVAGAPHSFEDGVCGFCGVALRTGSSVTPILE